MKLSTTEHFLQTESIQHILENHTHHPLSIHEFFLLVIKSDKTNSTLNRLATIALIYSFDFNEFINNNNTSPIEKQKMDSVFTSLIIERYFKKSFLYYLLEAELFMLLPKLNLFFKSLHLLLEKNEHNKFFELVLKSIESAFLSSHSEFFPLKLSSESTKLFFDIHFNILFFFKKTNELLLLENPSYLENYCYAYSSFIFQFEEYFPNENNPFLDNFNTHNDDSLALFYDLFSQLRNGYKGIKRIPRNHRYFKILFQKPIMSALAFKNNHRFFLKQSYCNTELALTIAPQYFV